jgi:hypothetical protein
LAVKEWLEPMADSPRFFFRQVQLTLTAGYFGVFPEAELIVGVRAVFERPGKVLVVQPVKSLCEAEERPRTYQARELSVSNERVAKTTNEILGSH